MSEAPIPIQELSLPKGYLPGILPVLRMFETLCARERFAMHPQTWAELLAQYHVPDGELVPERISLRDDLPVGYLHPMPPDPVHPFIRLVLEE
jgi:hypothetical protein